MEWSRRDFGLLMSVLVTPALGFSSDEGLLPAKAYQFEALPVQKKGENSVRPILKGKAHTGCSIKVEEVEIAPGGMPHPPHRHENAEQALLIIAGTFEVTIAGEITRLGPGSVAYVAINVEHGIQNTGTTPGQYFSVTVSKNDI